MTEEKLQPPHPIPYPNHWLIKKLYRFPILLYRLGLGKWIGKTISILSTYGRKTGKVHRTPVEYYRHQGKFYVMSGFGQVPDWYKNVQTDPHVTLNTDRGFLKGIARRPQSEKEWEGVYAFLKNSPVGFLSDTDMVRKLDDPKMQEQIKTWHVLTFDPTDEPCPPPLEADLLWAWPLILIGLALHILIGWLIKRGD